MNKIDWCTLCNDYDTDEDQNEDSNKQEELNQIFKNENNVSKDNISQDDKATETSNSNIQIKDTQDRQKILQEIDAVKEDWPVFINLWNVDNSVTLEAIHTFFANIEILEINDKLFSKGILDLKLKNKAEATKLIMIQNQQLGKRKYYYRFSSKFSLKFIFFKGNQNQYYRQKQANYQQKGQQKNYLKPIRRQNYNNNFETTKIYPKKQYNEKYQNPSKKYEFNYFPKENYEEKVYKEKYIPKQQCSSTTSYQVKQEKFNTKKVEKAKSFPQKEQEKKSKLSNNLFAMLESESEEEENF